MKMIRIGTLGVVSNNDHVYKVMMMMVVVVRRNGGRDASRLIMEGRDATILFLFTEGMKLWMKWRQTSILSLHIVTN